MRQTMTKKLHCSMPWSSHHYEIEIGSRIINLQMEYLALLASKFAIITDTTIAPLYGMELQNQLTSHGLVAYLFSFPSGEAHKTRATKEHLENQMFEKGLGRDTCLIALGGGIVTDVGGYIAATYCRGIPLVMIPTSLLGMVDASIGGKTGVNAPYGKNLLGCIYQPKKVILDLSLLKTLPAQELSNGFVEIIKHALITDCKLFQDLETHSDQLLALDEALLEKIIIASCHIKKEIVEEDERESGKRHLLNFGHTIGHALELLTNYSLSHGEAVAIGLVVESYLSMQMGHLNQNSFNRIKNILLDYALPLKLPSKFPIKTLLEAMHLDKKSIKGKPRFVIIEAIGSALSFNSHYCTLVETPLLMTALKWMNDALHCD